MKNKLINIAILFVTTFIMLVVAEYVFRALVFSNNENLSSLRDPGKYADYLNEDDYWKLYYKFDGEYRPPENPHPLLGWTGSFYRNSLIHNDAWSIGGRRPVLLYGDSYAQCMPETRCFQDFLNNDTAFADSHFFLNYGVGGFGVGQIYLMYRYTSHLYKDPFIVFSLMVSDMDRTPLKVRTGQKPYFEIADDSLILKGVPVDPDPDKFFAENPPEFSSYLYRRFLYSDMNVLPETLNRRLKKWDYYHERKIDLNNRVLTYAVNDLKKNKHDFVFVIFHYIEPGNPEFSVDNEDNWRDRLLRKFLADNDIPYIWTKDLIKYHPDYDGKNIDKFMILSNGHPTTFFNGIISESIRAEVEKNEAFRNVDTAYVSDIIRNTPEWYDSILQKSISEGKTADDALKDDAAFICLDLVEKGKLNPGPGYFQYKINMDKNWLSSIEDKSSHEGIELEDAIRTDAFYMYQQSVNERYLSRKASKEYDASITAIHDSLSMVIEKDQSLINDLTESGLSRDEFLNQRSQVIYNEYLVNRSWP